MNFFAFLLTAVIAIAGRLVFPPDSPAGRALTYVNNELAPNRRPDMGTLIALRRRERIPERLYFSIASMLGFNEYWATRFYDNSYLKLSPMDYITLFRRGVITKNSLDAISEFLGYKKEDVELMLKVTEFFPAPNDLVRFAVREVYTPEIADKFGLFEDLPQKFIDESSKAGLPEEQARNFWGAHWELPSPRQGFEMFQRRIIDRKTLNMLLKALDVMPFWRDKLTAMAYNTLTRVDVRRMYGMGVLNEDQVYDSYLDFGYSPENSRRMVEFTTRFENQEADGLTRANIIKAYKQGLINRSELIEYLQLLNYTDKVIDFWVEQADFERTTEVINLLKDDLIEAYRIGDLSIEEIREKLGKEDLPAVFVNRLVDEILLQESKRRKVPSKEDLENWLLNNIIEEEYYTSRMRLLGYKDIDIQNYLTEMAFQTDTENRKYLPIKKYQTWLTKRIMNVSQFRRTAEAMEFSGEDIERMEAESLAARS